MKALQPCLFTQFQVMDIICVKVQYEEGFSQNLWFLQHCSILSSSQQFSFKEFQSILEPLLHERETGSPKSQEPFIYKHSMQDRVNSANTSSDDCRPMRKHIPANKPLFSSPATQNPPFRTLFPFPKLISQGHYIKIVTENY